MITSKLSTGTDQTQDFKAFLIAFLYLCSFTFVGSKQYKKGRIPVAVMVWAWLRSGCRIVGLAGKCRQYRREWRNNSMSSLTKFWQKRSLIFLVVVLLPNWPYRAVSSSNKIPCCIRFYAVGMNNVSDLLFRCYSLDVSLYPVFFLAEAWPFPCFVSTTSLSHAVTFNLQIISKLSWFAHREKRPSHILMSPGVCAVIL